MLNRVCATEPIPAEHGEAVPTLIRRHAGALLLTPLILAALASLFMSARSIAFRVSLPYPVNPWESAFIMDARRAAEGLTVYEQIPTGHATHMYGPLGTYLLAGIFSITGPGVYSGRAVNLLAALGLSILFMFAFIQRPRLSYVLIGLAMVVALHYRCRAYFTETRPDALALLLAGLSLAAAYRAHRWGNFRWYAAVVPLCVLAFLTKQTYAAVAIVPPVAVLLTNPRPLRKHLLWSLSAAVSLAVVMVVIKTAFPQVWFYVVHVPSRFRIAPDRAWLALMSILMYSPLYLALAFAWGLHRSFDARRERKVMWLLSATVIGGAAGVVAFAKHGGTYNSLLLAFAPMTGFCIIALPRVFEIVREPHVAPVVRAAAALTLGLLFATTTFGIPLSERTAFGNTSNNENYDHTIRVVRRLRGRVLCPDEPTITLLAKHRFERSLDAELDAYGRPGPLPRAIVKYLRSADYIVRVPSNFDNLGFKSDRTMEFLGFDSVPTGGLRSGYSLWKRRSGTSLPSATQPAPHSSRPVRRQTN